MDHRFPSKKEKTLPRRKEKKKSCITILSLNKQKEKDGQSDHGVEAKVSYHRSTPEP